MRRAGTNAMPTLPPARTNALRAIAETILLPNDFTSY